MSLPRQKTPRALAPEQIEIGFCDGLLIVSDREIDGCREFRAYSLSPLAAADPGTESLEGLGFAARSVSFLPVQNPDEPVQPNAAALAPNPQPDLGPRRFELHEIADCFQISPQDLRAFQNIQGAERTSSHSQEQAPSPPPDIP
ncbi:hypothetical protein [Phaeobacter inhibens]|uniref:hypothetical protein n=1 Tax=Phaeobacter inhibens TaxID=221822 RepID=UPI0012E3E811|nr:hypothetical protein [Phaeobacter inhibens]WHP68839.1 hypothetical protein QMZ01_01230 [Phaeobacter inhibens]